MIYKPKSEVDRKKLRTKQNRNEDDVNLDLELSFHTAHEYIVLCYKNKSNTKFNQMMQPILENKSWKDVLAPMESVLENLGTTSSAKDEIVYILGKRDIFSTPKPLKLTKEMIRVASNKNSIILDFFAGSGTTGHATMDLNKEDGGHRKFILITNNEGDICKRITIPRIRNSINLYDYNETFEIY